MKSALQCFVTLRSVPLPIKMHEAANKNISAGTWFLWNWSLNISDVKQYFKFFLISCEVIHKEFLLFQFRFTLQVWTSVLLYLQHFRPLFILGRDFPCRALGTPIKKYWKKISWTMFMYLDLTLFYFHFVLL